MRKTVPASLTVIAVLHFVFGGLGVLTNTVGGILQAAGINRTLMSGGSVPSGSPDQALVQDMQKAIMNAPAYDLVQFINAGVGLLIAIIMIVSGLGLLKLRPWARYLSILYAFLSIGLKVFAVFYALAFMLPALNEFMRTHQPASSQGQMMISIMRMILIVSAVMPIVFMIYPAVVLIVMFLPSTAAAFRSEKMDQPLSDYDDPDEPVDVERADDR